MDIRTIKDLSESIVSGASGKNNSGTSKAAAKSVDARTVMIDVYLFMVSIGDIGCISDQLKVAFIGKHELNTITPRYADMIRLGMIELTGEQRMGSAGKMQDVRRALPEPFVRPFAKPKQTKKLKENEMTQLRRDVAIYKQKIMELENLIEFYKQEFYKQEF
jgi:hypothetical protein